MLTCRPGEKASVELLRETVTRSLGRLKEESQPNRWLAWVADSSGWLLRYGKSNTVMSDWADDDQMSSQ